MTPQETSGDSAQARVLDAVLRAHGILADYLEQGPRKCEQTLARLFAVLDDQELIAAVNKMNLESLTTREDALPLMREPSDRAS